MRVPVIVCLQVREFSDKVPVVNLAAQFITLAAPLFEIFGNREFLFRLCNGLFCCSMKSLLVERPRVKLEDFAPLLSLVRYLLAECLVLDRI